MQTQDMKVTKNDTVRQMADGKETVLVVHEVANQAGKGIGAAVESTVMGFGAI